MSKSLNDLPDGYLWHQCIEVLKETERRIDNLEAEGKKMRTYSSEEIRMLRKMVQEEMIEDGNAEGMTLSLNSLNWNTIEARVQTYVLAGVKPNVENP